MIHVGFAMARIDEEEAAMALASLKMMGGELSAEVDAFFAAPSTGDPAPRPVPR